MPNPNPGVWRELLKIRSYDVDFQQRASAEALCRYFLEAAWNHAEQLGFGFAALAQQNKFWVLSRLAAEIDSFPEWGQTVQLTTWPRGINGVFALRDFEIGTTEGERLAGGSSSWLVLDAITHRPQRLDKLLLPVATPETRRAISRDPEKIDECVMSATAFTAAVRYSDIDVNRHVNSARYIGWLLDAYPAVFLESHELRSIEVNYVGEGLWTDTLSVQSCERGPLHFAHSIIKAGQTEVCRAVLRWTPKSDRPPKGSRETA